MSSHHFVKDGQEPALLIAEPLSLELIGPLLEWAPYVMVVDTIVNDILNWGIKIDAVITNGNNGDLLTERISTQGSVEVICYKAGEHPVKAGIDFLIHKKQQAVNIVADVSDKTLEELLSLDVDILIAIITRNMKWSIISYEFIKWLPAQTTVYVRPSKTENIIYTGLKESEPGVLITEKDVTVTLRSEKSFWIGECL